LALAALLVGAGLALTGCSVLGFAAQAAAGPPTVSAAYALPKRPTVVLAERFDNPGESKLDADAIARFVTDELRQRNVVPFVDPNRAEALRQRDPAAYHDMTVAAIGRAVEAEQVIYINVIASDVETAPGTDMLRGTGEVLVKVVDARTGATRWPTDADAGRPVGAQTRMYSPREQGVTESTVRTLLHRQLADRVARLFYSYSAG
jgi:hypothetical protein